MKHTIRSAIATLLLVSAVVSMAPLHADARQQYKPNLVVLDASIAPSPRDPSTTTLFITLRNTSGAVAAPASVVEARDAGSEHRVNVPAIPRGHAITVELALPACAVVISVIADITAVVDESSESDNTLQSEYTCAAGSSSQPSFDPDIYR